MLSSPFKVENEAPSDLDSGFLKHISFFLCPSSLVRYESGKSLVEKEEGQKRALNLQKLTRAGYSNNPHLFPRGGISHD